MGDPEATSPFSTTTESTHSRAPAGRWPLHTLWAGSALGIAVSIFNNHVWSLIAYSVLLVASFVLLLLYRMSLVRHTRQAAASGTVLGVRMIEKVTIAAVIAASVANGVVIGLWIGSFDMWFA